MTSYDYIETTITQSNSKARTLPLVMPFCAFSGPTTVGVAMLSGMTPPETWSRVIIIKDKDKHRRNGDICIFAQEKL